MKVGDQKQAIALGIVALFAVGMLGKTAYGAFSSGNSNQPIVVKDVGGTGTRLPDTEQSAQASIPKATSEISHDSAPSANVTSVKRDAFQKPYVPVRTKSFSQESWPKDGIGESMTQTGSSNTLEPMKGNIDSGPAPLPSATKASPSSSKVSQEENKAKEPSTTLRFDGYVEAGSPMGILSLHGKSFSVSIGDPIGSGFEVESISSQKIKIRKGKIVKTVLIGKETKI